LNRDPLVKLAGDELAASAVRAGCRVLARTTLDDGSVTWPVLELDCGDNAHAIRFLNEAAAHDTSMAEVRDLSLRIRDAHPDARAFLEAVQAFVKAAVRFVREARETFQHTLYTLRRRAGDCDDHARAVAALALAGGETARIVGVPNAHGKVGHVATAVFVDGRWCWAETTIDARFGEHPRAAARRLGIGHARPDIWSDRRAGGRYVPAR
jgi:transglutaminase-like putative cysteine protease